MVDIADLYYLSNDLEINYWNRAEFGETLTDKADGNTELNWLSEDSRTIWYMPREEEFGCIIILFLPSSILALNHKCVETMGFLSDQVKLKILI